MMIAPVPAHDDILPPESFGGFTWWYVDLVDERGDGAVIIWGFALPFIAPDPTLRARDLPFLNICVYQGGVCTCYHLESVHSTLISMTDEGWTFDRSWFRSRRRGDAWEVQARLDVAVAGSDQRLTAELSARGPAVYGVRATPGEHRWAPLCMPASGTLEVQRGAWSARLSGRVYHDRNSSDKPLPQGGLREWAWGRVAMPDHEALHYVCWPDGGGGPEALGVRVGPDGRAELAEIGWGEHGSRGGWWGYSAPSEIKAGGVEIGTAAIVDESPFYLRFGLRADSPQGPRFGWGERVRPHAIGLWWMQPLVRMRVAWPSGSSALLPMFSGPRDDRLPRLWSGLWR